MASIMTGYAVKFVPRYENFGFLRGFLSETNKLIYLVTKAMEWLGIIFITDKYVLVDMIVSSFDYIFWSISMNVIITSAFDI